MKTIAIDLDGEIVPIHDFFIRGNDRYEVIIHPYHWTQMQVKPAQFPRSRKIQMLNDGSLLVEIKMSEMLLTTV